MLYGSWVLVGARNKYRSDQSVSPEVVKVNRTIIVDGLQRGQQEEIS